MTVGTLLPPKHIVCFGNPNPATSSYYDEVMPWCTMGWATTWAGSTTNVEQTIETLVSLMQMVKIASPNWWSVCMVDVTPLWFGPDKRPRADGTNNYQSFVQACIQGGVYLALSHAYMCDEADANGYSAADFVLVCRSIHNVTPWVRCCSTFNNYGTALPYVEDLQGIGFDAYPGSGGAEIGPMESLITRSDQFLMLCAGVGSGQGVAAADPGPYLSYMKAHPLVKVLMLFCWFDGWANNTANLGARSDGRAQECIDAGNALMQDNLTALVRTGPPWEYLLLQ